MENSPPYLEVGFPVKNEFSFIHVWIRCTDKNKEAIKSYFQYKLGHQAVIDSGTYPLKAMKQFVLLLPTDHNLADVLASSVEGLISVDTKDATESGYSRPPVMPSLTIGVVSGECEDGDYPYLEEFIKEKFVADTSSPIPLDHFAVEIKPTKDKR